MKGIRESGSYLQTQIISQEAKRSSENPITHISDDLSQRYTH
ncbi:hypothetical protein [Neisseria mucosa]|nr:hypothetical protein [Neisseria mucosa]